MWAQMPVSIVAHLIPSAVRGRLGAGYGLQHPYRGPRGRLDTRVEQVWSGDCSHYRGWGAEGNGGETGTRHFFDGLERWLRS